MRLSKLGEVLSIFIDESGDFGFIKDASKYYIITLVFHEQQKNIVTNIKKIQDQPVFHAGPIIRREFPFQNESMETRKKIFQRIFLFAIGLPIQCKTFVYNKKDFKQDIYKMEARMSRDLYLFLVEHLEYLQQFKLNIYYDNGQQSVTRILNHTLSISGLDYEFKKKVQPDNYRLFQVADFISTIRLLEVKMLNKEQSSSEKKFVDARYFKKNYLKGINKKVLK